MAKQPKKTDADEAAASVIAADLSLTEEQARERYPATAAAFDAFRAANPDIGEVALKVTAKVDGFRRGGIAHHGTVTYRGGELSPDQVEQILTEPQLAAHLVAVEAGPATAD